MVRQDAPKGEEVMLNDQLILRKVLKDGRVLAVNVWRTGFQELVYPDRDAFDRAKPKVEAGEAPHVGGYSVVK